MMQCPELKFSLSFRKFNLLSILIRSPLQLNCENDAVSGIGTTTCDVRCFGNGCCSVDCGGVSYFDDLEVDDEESHSLGTTLLQHVAT